ncbi:MAG: signal peptidase I [Pseudomonadales bacterium]|nr:signal peptidase I [Pseudomonadales bacterium]
MLKITLLTFCLLIPGGSLWLSQYRTLALGVPIFGLIWVTLICCSRWIIEPTGFSSLLIGLLSLHLLTWFLGVFISFSNKSLTPSWMDFSSLLLPLMVSITIGVSCHFYKANWFGFAFYHIPSISMLPTLVPGDIILVDTWAYKNAKTDLKDIVLFQQKLQPKIYIKRVTAIEMQEYQWLDKNKYWQKVMIAENHSFVVGDNPEYSNDSRNFGAINNEQVFAKAEFIIISVGAEWQLREVRSFKAL